MQDFLCRYFGGVLACALVWGGLLALPSAAATTFDNGGGDGLLTNGSNWTNLVPDNGPNPGTVPGGFTVLNTDINALDSKNLTFQGNSIFNSTSAGVKSEDVVLTFQDSSTWNQTGAIALGRDSTPAGISVLNLSGTATVTATGDVKLGRAQSTFVNQSGGSFATGVGGTDGLELGNLANSGVASYTLSGGTVSALGGDGLKFQNGSLFTISGGNVTATQVSYSNGNGSFDFTLGSTGSLTVLNGGGDYTSTFETYITSGFITLGGAQAQFSDFNFDYLAATETTLSLVGAPAPQTLELLVNTTTGEVSLHNPTGAAVSMDYYEIRSAAGDLIAGFDADFEPDGDVDSADLAIWQAAYGVNGNADADNDGDSDGADFLSWQRGLGASAANSGWESLEDQDFEGNGDSSSGNGWQEGATVSSELLFETYLTGDSEIADGATISLGNLFAVGGAETLTFEYHVATDGEVFTAGDVTYAPALAAATAVPEPTTLTLLAMGLAGLAGRRRA